MAAVDTHGLTLRERKDLLWTLGNLEYLCLPRQLPVYRQFWAWWEEMQKPEVQAANLANGAKYINMQVWELCRRFGKTALAEIIATEMMIRFPGSVGMITTTVRAEIGKIVLKPLDDIMRDEAPEGYFPQYHSSKDGLNAQLRVPATGSVAILHGLDLHPNRLRGGGLDWFLCTEAAMCSFDLAETYRAKISQQFQGRPHAWALFESTPSEQGEDHPFHKDLVPDAELRDAYVRKTILDMGYTPEQITYWEAQSGGRDANGVLHPTAQRELYLEFSRDKERAVCSSLTSSNILAPHLYEPPKYGLGVVGLDPGNTDQAGLVFLVIEPSKRIATCVSSWGGTKTSTDDLAAMIREREKALWGTRAEVTSSETKRPLQDILKAPREVPLQTVSMERLSIDNPTLGSWDHVVDSPHGTCTWWDDMAKTLRPNPWVRVMDVATQQRQDMRERHGLMFEQPSKGRDNMALQIDLLNDHLHDGTLRILDNEANQQLLRQMRSGRWNERRTDFEKSKQLAHLDIVVALAIACRMIRWDIDPRRPLHVDYRAAGYFTPPSTRKLLQPLRSREKQRRRIDRKRYR